MKRFVFALSFALLLALASIASAVEVFTVATEGAFAPYNYINENGEPDGYDVAVAKAVDELIPEIEFKIQPVDWASIFVGFEAGRYELIVSQIAKTIEREERYLYSDVPYAWEAGAIAFLKGRTDIQKMEDLIGKTVTVGVGGEQAIHLENWNNKHGGKIKIVYNDGNIAKMLLDVENRRVDATVTNPVTAALIAKEQGLDIDFVLRGDVDFAPVYWLFTKDEKGEKLKSLVDAALKTLIENGKLKELSEKYLGGDYSTKEGIEARLGK
ncbi:MAG: transporter substrate-binding domain-containing protein [Synergistaceae bacterium]|nr:transporter substrate-binding domain-containing protein [Synergistaceae bacterium]